MSEERIYEDSSNIDDVNQKMLEEGDEFFDGQKVRMVFPKLKLAFELKNDNGVVSFRRTKFDLSKEDSNDS